MTMYNSTARLEQARQRQLAVQQRIETLATNSIVAWLSTALRRLVGPVVHAVVGWFANFFR